MTVFSPPFQEIRPERILAYARKEKEKKAGGPDIWFWGELVKKNGLDCKCLPRLLSRVTKMPALLITIFFSIS